MDSIRKSGRSEPRSDLERSRSASRSSSSRFIVFLSGLAQSCSFLLLRLALPAAAGIGNPPRSNMKILRPGSSDWGCERDAQFSSRRRRGRWWMKLRRSLSLRRPRSKFKSAFETEISIYMPGMECTSKFFFRKDFNLILKGKVGNAYECSNPRAIGPTHWMGESAESNQVNWVDYFFSKNTQFSIKFY